LLFENCSCTLVCPGHVHFSQRCTFERCKGYWALEFAEGRFGTVDLAGIRAVVVFDSPQTMIEGNWTRIHLVDESTTKEQREALEIILNGKAGGPWEVLARFVGKQLPTRYVQIRFEEEGRTKRVVVNGLLKGDIQEITGSNKGQPVRIENMFNQIHAPSQVLAVGSTHYDDGHVSIHNDKSHGLHSHFNWSVNE
jgi:hypothetical protein